MNTVCNYINNYSKVMLRWFMSLWLVFWTTWHMTNTVSFSGNSRIHGHAFEWNLIYKHLLDIQESQVKLMR